MPPPNVVLAGLDGLPLDQVDPPAQDALEYLIAGATAVQVGTGAFRDPRLFAELLEGLRSYLVKGGHTHVREIIASLEGMPEPVG